MYDEHFKRIDEQLDKLSKLSGACVTLGMTTLAASISDCQCVLYAQVAQIKTGIAGDRPDSL